MLPYLEDFASENRGPYASGSLAPECLKSGVDYVYYIIIIIEEAAYIRVLLRVEP